MKQRGSSTVQRAPESRAGSKAARGRGGGNRRSDRSGSAASDPRTKRTIAATLFVFAVAFATFGPALANGFVWDDTLILGKQLSAFPTLASVFSPPANIPHYSPFYYRPIVILTYLADRALGGGAAFPFHLTPIVLHAITASLLLLLLLRMLGARAQLASIAAALLFAVHPAHAEVAAWMAGRSDALAAVGVLAALLAWGRWLESARPIWLAAGAAALLFGLLGKEAAVIGVPLAAALPWVWPHQRDRRQAVLRLFGAIAVSVAAYLILRATGPGFATGRRLPSSAGAGDVLGAIGFYAGALFWPSRAGVVLTFVPADGTHVLLGLIAVIVWLVVLVWAYVRRSFVVLWALLWVALGLIPPLVLVFRAVSETPVAERYLYLPSLGVAVLLAVALARLRGRWQRTGLVATAAVGIACAVHSARCARLWHDDLHFWSNAVAAAPNEGFARGKLAFTLHRHGQTAAAEAEFRSALEARLSGPQRAVVENNLGWLLLDQQRRAEAEPLFRDAVAAGPAFAGPYRGLAESLWLRGDDPTVRAEIKRMLEKAVQLDPHDARVAFLLGSVHLSEGDREQAIRLFEQAVRANPNTGSAMRARSLLATLLGG